jgi:hypothetical protein
MLFNAGSTASGSATRGRCAGRGGRTYVVENGVLNMKIQEPGDVPSQRGHPLTRRHDECEVASDLNSANNTASVVLRRAPRGEFIVETAVKLTVPDDPDCCYNYAQGGVLVYQDDDNFVKLTQHLDLEHPPDRVGQGDLPGGGGLEPLRQHSRRSAVRLARVDLLRIAVEVLTPAQRLGPVETRTASPRTPVRTARVGYEGGRGRTRSPTAASGWSPWGLAPGEHEPGE